MNVSKELNQAKLNYHVAQIEKVLSNGVTLDVLEKILKDTEFKAHLEGAYTLMNKMTWINRYEDLQRMIDEKKKFLREKVHLDATEGMVHKILHNADFNASLMAAGELMEYVDNSVDLPDDKREIYELHCAQLKRYLNMEITDQLVYALTREHVRQDFRELEQLYKELNADD